MSEHNNDLDIQKLIDLYSKNICDDNNDNKNQRWTFAEKLVRTISNSLNYEVVVIHTEHTIYTSEDYKQFRTQCTFNDYFDIDKNRNDRLLSDILLDNHKYDVKNLKRVLGYDVYLLNKHSNTLFTINHDGGDLNWAYTSGWNRISDTTILLNHI